MVKKQYNEVGYKMLQHKQYESIKLRKLTVIFMWDTIKKKGHLQANERVQLNFKNRSYRTQVTNLFNR